MEIPERSGKGQDLGTVKNNDSALGISHSVHLALDQIRSITRSAFPSVTAVADPRNHQGLVTAFRKNNKGMACVTCDGVDGNPVVLHRSTGMNCFALSGDVGGKKVLLAHPEECDTLFGKNPQELADVDEKFHSFAYNQND